MYLIFWLLKNKAGKLEITEQEKRVYRNMQPVKELCVKSIGAPVLGSAEHSPPCDKPRVVS